MKRTITTLCFLFSTAILYAQFPCQAGFNHFNGQNGTQFYDASLAQPTSWLWNFGDGSSDTARNPLHKYSQPGTYYVCLIISDGASCTDTACDSVTVTSTPGGGGNCTAGFNAYPGGMGNSVTFGNTSVPQTATWSWDFGDGTTDTAKGPTHNFPNPGTYWVCLTMTDTTGCKDTICDSVTAGSGLPTGRYDSVLESSLHVYPVPSAGEFIVEYYSASVFEMTITLFSYEGKKIKILQEGLSAAGLNRIRWSETLDAGVYLLGISSPERTFFRRVIIIK